MSARTPIATAVLGVAVLAAIPRSATAQPFVYDTRATIFDGTWNAFRMTAIGDMAENGFNQDEQAADDFTLTSRTRLTHITVDMIELVSGTGMPSGGVLVEVFPNIAGNHPGEIPTASLLVLPASVTLEGTFPQAASFNAIGDRMTLGIDLTGGSITLDPGTWWISVTPKNDGNPLGSRFNWAGTNTATGIGPAHYRCGGVAHGNNYPCINDIVNNHPTWTPVPYVSPNTPLATNFSMRIDGNVQSTTGACCNGTTCSVGTQTACVAAYQGDNSTCGPTGNPTTCCPANFNGASGVNVADIFAFLSAWFANSPSADFNGVGGVNVADIFAFLTAWFAGC